MIIVLDGERTVRCVGGQRTTTRHRDRRRAALVYAATVLGWGGWSVDQLPIDFRVPSAESGFTAVSPSGAHVKVDASDQLPVEVTPYGRPLSANERRTLASALAPLCPRAAASLVTSVADLMRPIVEAAEEAHRAFLAGSIALDPAAQGSWEEKIAALRGRLRGLKSAMQAILDADPALGPDELDEVAGLESRWRAATQRSSLLELILG